MIKEHVVEDKVSFRYYLEHNHDYIENSKNYGCVHDGVSYGANMTAIEMSILNICENNTRVIANKIYSEKEYIHEKELLEIHSNNSKSDIFRDLTFQRKNKSYHMSVNVNMCRQMDYCCEIVPEQELDNWFFRLKVFPVYEDKNEKEYVNRSKKVITLSEEELLKKYEKEKSGRKRLSRQKGTKSSPYKRSEVVSELAKRRAKGICELSDENNIYHKAPFDVDGTPYLESHHVEWLSRGGQDVLENVVALCPNCHKKIHILNEKTDNQKLLDRLQLYAKKINRINEKDVE